MVLRVGYDVHSAREAIHLSAGGGWVRPDSL
jgi:hypothetical protein